MYESAIYKNHPFEKDNFTWDGEYLMYDGPYNGQKTMDEVHPNCHPSWVGKRKPAFIARFKYKKPYKRWINTLVKNATVEQFLMLSDETDPLTAISHFGYKG